MWIANVSRSWRFLSVQIAALAVVWGSLPVDMQTAMLSAVGISESRIPAILGVLFLVARLIKQPADGDGKAPNQ